MAIQEDVRHNDKAAIRLLRLVSDNGLQLRCLLDRCRDRFYGKRRSGGFEWVQVFFALVTCGAISFSSANHLPAIVGSIFMKPVTLPPGRLRLVTKPLPTGSETSTKIVGMVRVSPRTA